MEETNIASRSLAAAEDHLSQKIEELEKLGKVLWAFAVAGFVVGTWSAAMQWQIVMLRNDVEQLNREPSNGARALFEKASERTSKQDQVIQSIQLNQQQTIDQLRYLVDDVKALKEIHAPKP